MLITWKLKISFPDLQHKKEAKCQIKTLLELQHGRRPQTASSTSFLIAESSGVSSLVYYQLRTRTFYQSLITSKTKHGEGDSELILLN